MSSLYAAYLLSDQIAKRIESVPGDVTPAALIIRCPNQSWRPEHSLIATVTIPLNRNNYEAQRQWAEQYQGQYPDAEVVESTAYQSGRVEISLKGRGHADLEYTVTLGIVEKPATDNV